MKKTKEMQIRDSFISEKESKQYFKSLSAIVDSAAKFLSSIDVFIRLKEENGQVIEYYPISTIDGITIALREQYGSWGIWDMKIGEVGRLQEDGLPEDGIEKYKAFDRDYKDSLDFCTTNMMQITLTIAADERDLGLRGGTFNTIRFAMYFSEYKKVDNGVILRLCTSDELREKYPQIAENVFWDFYSEDAEDE